MVKILAIVAFSFLITACTTFYSREYQVQPTQQMSQQDIESIFNSFREFLISKGLRPINQESQVKPNEAIFKISGSEAGFAFRQDWEDTLKLSYSESDGFKLRLFRISHHPDDFTDEYLKQFIEKTEKFIFEATAKHVHITLIQQRP